MTRVSEGTNDQREWPEQGRAPLTPLEGTEVVRTNCGGRIAPGDVSVVVATYERADALRRCLEHLQRLDDEPTEILVVDASPTSATRKVVDDFDGVGYVRNDKGLGTLPQSRRIGFEQTSGLVVAYVDDDAYVEPQWLAELAAAYDDGVGGVVGRARRGTPGEESAPADQVGRLFPDGRCTGNFAADIGKIIEVDHMIGCNMSVRRSALEAVGGPPDWDGGRTGQREDLFISLLITQQGWRIRYAPAADLYHEGAPTPKGERFDFRYRYEGARNHVFVLATIFGPTAPITRRSIKRAATGVMNQSARGMVSALASPVSTALALLRGLLAAGRYRTASPR